MERNIDNKHRRTIRLYGYDYSSDSCYFITLCTQEKKCLFGRIVDGTMQLNELGKIVEQCWNEIPLHYPHTELIECMIMPNHLHAILHIVGAEYLPPEETHEPNSAQRGTLGSIIKGFKIGVTKQIGHSIWQRNYYEHIIRNAREFDEIVRYIRSNPTRWCEDEMFCI